MVSPIQQDTPVHRASIAEMTIEQIETLVDSMRERRMRAHNAYQLAQEAKAREKLQKDKARYDKLLVMFETKIKSVDAGLESMSKYLNELKVLEIMGE
jgi:predicted  nucleic acid-binding Zn-ribbon protein